MLSTVNVSGHPVSHLHMQQQQDNYDSWNKNTVVIASILVHHTKNCTLPHTGGSIIDTAACYPT